MASVRNPHENAFLDASALFVIVKDRVTAAKSRDVSRGVSALQRLRWSRHPMIPTFMPATLSHTVCSRSFFSLKSYYLFILL